MKRYVITHNAIEGFHMYPEAPDFCKYLGNTHRHIFVVICEFEVQHNNRQTEINQRQLEIASYFSEKYGMPCQFGALSCEDIAEDIITNLGATSVKVLEDGYGGAYITR